MANRFICAQIAHAHSCEWAENFCIIHSAIAGMTSSSLPHVASKFSPKPFIQTYSGPSDDQLSLSSAGTSSNSGRSVPREARSGENLDVAATVSGAVIDAGIIAPSDAAPCDGTESSSVYPNTSDDPQTEVSVGGTSESDVSLTSREEGDQTPRNLEHVENNAANHDYEEDIGGEDEHRETNQISTQYFGSYPSYHIIVGVIHGL